MYSQKQVEKRLQLIEREFHFRPVQRYVHEIDQFEERLRTNNRYTFDELGRPSGVQNTTPDESRWMLNEQLMCLADAAYFLTRYCYLRNEEGVVMRFRFRVPQRIYFEMICDLQDRGQPIEIMILKARQLGMSVFTELLMTHRTTFTYGTTAVIGSADQTKTGDMSKMMLFAYDMLPVWLRPQYTSRVESDRGKMLFGHMASGVTFQHGSQKFGIGTGSTPTLYHLSEVALYGDSAVMLIDEGLWKAVHASEHVFGILESTGRSNKGWWADTWYYSKKNWPRSRMYALFLPWFCGLDIYPKPADLLRAPIPSNWRPHPDTRAHVAKAELYVESVPLLKKHLLAENARRGNAMSVWRMPREQQWYWEINHEEAKAKGTESNFLQEMAGDDDEALQHSEESVFGHTTIAEVETRRKRDYETFAIVGQSIEDGHNPDPTFIDYDKERVRVRYKSHKGNYGWELVPVKLGPLREDESEDARGVLFIYHHPRPGVAYSIGVDTSEGKGEDSTVISVWALGYRGEPDTQVAEFASDFVNHVEAYAFALAIAAYYGQHMSRESTRWKEPYVTIEQVAAVGDTCQLQMAQMGYGNFHRFSRLDNIPRKIMKLKKTTNKRGWYTYGWSRPILTGHFVKFIRDGWATVNSPWLLEEMRHFEVHYTAGGKERMEHEEGQHDDRIFAAAMAIFCPHDMDVLADRSKKRIDEPAQLPRVDLSDYAGTVIAGAQLRESRVQSIEEVLASGGELEPYRY